MKTVFLFFLSSVLFAQVDTTEWYPAKNGNCWIFQPEGLSEKIVRTIAGDTLLNNGKSYKIVKDDHFYESVIYHYEFYHRVEDNSRVYEFIPGNSEYLLYDFICPVNESWEVIPGYWSKHRRVAAKGSVWSNVFKKYLNMIEFENMYMRGDDTVYWEREWQQIGKGAGLIGYGESGGEYKLIGAVIDGQTYGDVSEVNGENILNGSFYLSQNYPNPFNPSTTISYQIPKDDQVILKVYDLLGREVATLINEFQRAGRYNIRFDVSSPTTKRLDISSGVYIYTIRTGNFFASKKFVFVK